MMIKKTQHISEYQEGFKKYFKLIKKRSPLFIEFMTDDLPDEWLIDIVRYKRTSGIVVDHFVIRECEMDYWTKIYENEGWVKEDLTTS